MNARARMIDLAGKMLAPEDRTAGETATVQPKAGRPKTRKLVFRKPPRQQRPALAEAVEVERPYGERGDFEKVTVTLPSDVRALLLDESLRRKKQRSKDWPITMIMREAIAAYLSRRGE
jgi:hypothetical protein